LTSSLDSLPEGRTLEDVDAARSVAGIDAMRARRERFATHEHRTTHEDLDSARRRTFASTRSLSAVTLTVRAFEE